MASSTLTSRTIRGIAYSQGDSFICAYAASGNAGSEGDGGSAAALTVGNRYYFLGYAVADDSGTTIKYPCKIGSSSSTSSAIGWYPESVFPYATYTIKYNANGGTGAPSSQTKTHGTNLTLSSTKPTRTGYTFKGWALTQAEANSGDWYYQSGGTCGKNENLTLYAVWDANSYTYNIVYKSSSGIQLGTDTIAKDYGTTNTVSPKAFTGYTSPSSQSIKWDSTSAKTITFTYTPISYNVTINCNGGSGVSSRTYTIETATFTLGTPTRTGCTFSGWTGSNGTTAQKTVSISKGSTGDKSYVAQWKINTYTIVYNSNGGSGSMSSQSVEWQEVFLLSKNAFTREGHKFVGWNLYRNNDNKWYALGQGWLTESEIASNGYSKKVYADQQELTLDLSWIRNNESARQFTLYAVWEVSGVVYIDNGNSLDPYLIYIDNGLDWDLYIGYIDNGMDWNVIS